VRRTWSGGGAAPSLWLPLAPGRTIVRADPGTLSPADLRSSSPISNNVIPYFGDSQRTGPGAQTGPTSVCWPLLYCRTDQPNGLRVPVVNTQRFAAQEAEGSGWSVGSAI